MRRAARNDIVFAGLGLAMWGGTAVKCAPMFTPSQLAQCGAGWIASAPRGAGRGIRAVKRCCGAQWRCAAAAHARSVRAERHCGCSSAGARVSPAPPSLAPAVLVISVAWPLLWPACYQRWRVPGIAFLQLFLFALPFNFSTAVFDVLAPHHGTGRLAWVYNVFQLSMSERGLQGPRS